jgi:hypothetical protein
MASRRSFSRSGFTGIPALLALALTASGCGSSNDDSDGDGGNGTGTGVISEPWLDYCTATFTEDYEVVDVFGEVTFTAHEGDSYLMSADAGPWEFEIEGTAGAFPFTSNCEFGTSLRYYAAFTDVAVYDSDALETKLCDIAAGTALALDSTGAGYSITGSSSPSGTVYEVILNSFGAACGGATKGYVNVPPTTVFGTHTYLVPIQVIIGPAG